MKPRIVDMTLADYEEIKWYIMGHMQLHGYPPQEVRVGSEYFTYEDYEKYLEEDLYYMRNR